MDAREQQLQHLAAIRDHLGRLRQIADALYMWITWALGAALAWLIVKFDVWSVIDAYAGRLAAYLGWG